MFRPLYILVLGVYTLSVIIIKLAKRAENTKDDGPDAGTWRCNIYIYYILYYIYGSIEKFAGDPKSYSSATVR